MRATYGDFQAKKQRGGLYPPPVGQYIGEIQNIRLDRSYNNDRDVIVCMVEITEGEYKDIYHKIFADQQERFGGEVKYKGTFTLTPPIDGDEPWVKQRWESNLWCVQDSNPGYVWDWDEKKLKGKKVGLNIRENTYTGKNDGKEHTTTEVGQFESINDIRAGKCKDMKPRGKKKTQEEASTDGSEFTGIEYGTDVSGNVEVPF